MPSAWFFSDEGKKRLNFQREKLVISYIGSSINSKNHNNISGNLRCKRMKMSHNQCKILAVVYDKDGKSFKICVSPRQEFLDCISTLRYNIIK